MQLIALVPMKGHSERVPNKNMKPFCGEPLFHAIVKTLQSCPLIEKIVIDTDSEIIAADAIQHFSKVHIIMRPMNLRGDFVSMNEIIRHDISCFPDKEHFIQTHSTNPLLKVDTITDAIQTYESSINQGYDSLFGVTKHQARFFGEQGNAINHNPAELIRTQDLPPLYEENSNVYLFSRKSFLEAENKRIGVRPKMFEVNKMESIDIDENEDFQLAEMMALQQRNA